MLWVLLGCEWCAEDVSAGGTDVEFDELRIMANYTDIEWTGRTLNPIIAYHVETGKRGWFCLKVGPECWHCYAESLNKGRFGNGVRYAVDQKRLVRIEFVQEILTRPLRWRKSQRIFLCDMTDLFLEHHPFEWINEVFFMIYRAKQHFFQVLTKRVDRALQWWASEERKKFWEEHCLPDLSEFENFIFMASTGNQEAYDERMPLLIKMPARYKGLSIEPLLGPIDMSPTSYMVGGLVAGRGTNVNNDDWLMHLDWVIVGGESGSRARPMHLDWARKILLRCEQRTDMGRPWPLPAFMKQVGSMPVMSDAEWRNNSHTRLLSAKRWREAPDGTVPIRVYHPKGGDPEEWTPGLRVREFPLLAMPYARMFPGGVRHI